MGGPPRKHFDERSWLERARARLAAVTAIGLVAASGGLLSEMSRQAQVQAETPEVLVARG
jgi:hypothetical protein